MIDDRAVKLADLVLEHSVSAREGDRLIVQFDPYYAHYATLIGEKARKKGVNVRYDSLTFDSTYLRGLIERQNEQEWAEELERRKELSAWCNCRILVDCEKINNFAEGIPDAAKRIVEFDRQVVGPYKKVLYRPGNNEGYDVRWNLVGFPCEKNAMMAGMTLREYEDFVYNATIKNNWTEMQQLMQRIKQIFHHAKDVHIYVPDKTDLHLSLADRGGRICCGKRNMPDGEVYFTPVEISANGKIAFQIPTKRSGTSRIDGIQLEFKDGFVVNHFAAHNQDVLDEILARIPETRQIGEFGIACNYGITRATLETLFDEKIGGTIHLALGYSLGKDLEDGGGLYPFRGQVHWDLICDLRKNLLNIKEYPGGEISVDEKVVQKNGLWL